TLSAARIGSELRLLAAESDPVAALRALDELGAATAIDPALAFPRQRAAIATTALDALPPGSRRDLTVLAAALLDTPRERLMTLLDSFEYPAADRDAIIEAATDARRLAAALATVETGSAIAREVGTAGVATIALATALGDPARPRQWLSSLSHRTLQITGADLLAAGVPEGPAIGRGLAAARDAMLDEEAGDRETQLRVALAHCDEP
ncbi:MAG: hypothetical protein ACRDKL_00660, partial [Solirubrobacteraceae bacterium]